MDTIIINNREYAVEKLPGEGTEEDSRPYYRLTGKRGAVYCTLRNKPNPDMMFLMREGRMMLMKGVWLSDAGGTLRQVA